MTPRADAVVPAVPLHLEGGPCDRDTHVPVRGCRACNASSRGTDVGERRADRANWALRCNPRSPDTLSECVSNAANIVVSARRASNDTLVLVIQGNRLPSVLEIHGNALGRF